MARTGGQRTESGRGRWMPREIIKTAFLPLQSRPMPSHAIPSHLYFWQPSSCLHLDDQQLLDPSSAQPGILGPAVKQAVALAVQAGTKQPGVTCLSLWTRCRQCRLVTGLNSNLAFPLNYQINLLLFCFSLPSSLDLPVSRFPPTAREIDIGVSSSCAAVATTVWERAATSQQWHLRNLAACATGGDQHRVLPLSETTRSWLHCDTSRPSRPSPRSSSLRRGTRVD
jgi:hypothetical protein